MEALHIGPGSLDTVIAFGVTTDLVTFTCTPLIVGRLWYVISYLKVLREGYLTVELTRARLTGGLVGEVNFRRLGACTRP